MFNSYVKLPSLVGKSNYQWPCSIAKLPVTSTDELVRTSSLCRHSGDLSPPARCKNRGWTYVSWVTSSLVFMGCSWPVCHMLKWLNWIICQFTSWSSFFTNRWYSWDVHQKFIGYHRSQPSQAIPGTLFPDLPRATKLERYPTRAEMFQRDEGMNSWLFDPQSSVNSELGMNEPFSSLFTYLSERSLYPVRVNGVDSVWALCDSNELAEAGIKSLTGCLASSQRTWSCYSKAFFWSLL